MIVLASWAGFWGLLGWILIFRGLLGWILASWNLLGWILGFWGLVGSGLLGPLGLDSGLLGYNMSNKMRLIQHVYLKSCLGFVPRIVLIL